MRLYRSMKEAPDGFPDVGPSSRLLGVRPGNATKPDVLAVLPTDPVLPGQGGMSVAPDDPMNLPRHLRPASLGGSGRDSVWYIDMEDLGSDLAFRQDRPTHGLIEPQRALSLREFQDALAGSRLSWKLYCR
jgi:hypothetical protein